MPLNPRTFVARQIDLDAGVLADNLQDIEVRLEAALGNVEQPVQARNLNPRRNMPNADIIADTIASKVSDIRSFIADPSLIMPNLQIGVELEVERARALRVVHAPRARWWSFHEDNSLKIDGCEIVFKYPLFGKDIRSALKELGTIIKKAKDDGDVLEQSNRTSMHVHLDMRGLSFKEGANVIKAFLLFDSLLFSLGGADRKYNHFCYSPQVANGLIYSYAYLIENWENPDAIKNSNAGHKYSSVNIASIVEHGSLELRHHGGTTDPHEVEWWILVLMSIYKFGITNKMSTFDLVYDISKKSVYEFLMEVFGNLLNEHIGSLDYSKDVYEGIRLLQAVEAATKLDTSQNTINEIEALQQKGEM